MTKVLDQGFVELVQVCADDLTVANAARVSLATRADILTLKDEKLIALLMQERHTVPFEHTLFTFHVACPLFVTQHFLKHRISSISQQSGRYSVLPDKYYVADYVRTQVGKSMSYKYEPVAPDVKTEVQDIFIDVHDESHVRYQHLLDLGVAKEQARTVLPQTIYTEFWFTVNAHSLMNFLKLRNDEHAQWETRQYAIAIEEFFKEQMPVTFNAFKEHWVSSNEEEN